MDKYETRIVAFIDILGFKDIIRKSETDPGAIRSIQSILQYLKAWETNGLNEWNTRFMQVEDDALVEGVESFKISDSVACTCFSDSIVVSVLYQRDKLNEIASTLISNLSYIGSKLLMAGILIRGGMTIGNLIHSEDGTVLGSSLIEAYELETNVAKTSRIVLSNKLINSLNYPAKSRSKKYPYHQYLMRFDDGCVGFHQLQFYQVMQAEQTIKYKIKYDLDIIRKQIIDMLDTSFENPDVFMKYKWMADQYNNLMITDEELKLKIYDVNMPESSNNVHYGYIDSVMNKKKK